MPALQPANSNNGGFLDFFGDITDALNKSVDVYARFREANGDFDNSEINDRTPSNEPFNEQPNSMNDKIVLYGGIGLGVLALVGVLILARKK